MSDSQTLLCTPRKTFAGILTGVMGAFLWDRGKRGVNLTYNNPALPFGPNAQARNNYPGFHAMLSRQW